MRLPTYLVIGGMKCGSSSLHEYLRSNPDVFASRQLGVDPGRFPAELPREANRSDNKPRSVRPWAEQARRRSRVLRDAEARMPKPARRAWGRLTTTPTIAASPVAPDLDARLREMFADNLVEPG